MSRAMMPITTSSSTSVKPPPRRDRRDARTLKGDVITGDSTVFASFPGLITPVAMELDRRLRTQLRELSAAGNPQLVTASGLVETSPGVGVPVAAASGAPVVIVNAQPTPYDRIAGAVVREPISEALPELVRQE